MIKSGYWEVPTMKINEDKKADDSTEKTNY